MICTKKVKEIGLWFRKNWLALLLAFLFISIFLAIFYIFIFLFGDVLLTAAKEKPWFLIITVIYTFVMFLYLKVRLRKESWFLKAFYDVLILPIGLVIIFLSAVASSGALDVLSPAKQWFVLLTLILGIGLVTAFLVLRHRHAPPLMEVIKVVLDYLDIVYWTVFSVLAVLFSFSNLEILKFFAIPFLIQVKLIKAITGHIKLKETPQVRFYHSLSKAFFKVIDIKNRHPAVYKNQFDSK